MAEFYRMPFRFQPGLMTGTSIFTLPKYLRESLANTSNFNFIYILKCNFAVSLKSKFIQLPKRNSFKYWLIKHNITWTQSSKDKFPVVKSVMLDMCSIKQNQDYEGKLQGLQGETQMQYFEVGWVQIASFITSDHIWSSH